MFLGKIIVLIVLLLVAYQFYRGFRSSVLSFEREGENIGRVSDEFVRALFGCIGHLAKSDGRVSEDEIRAARLVMHRLGLSPARVRRAIHWFDDGKRPGFPLVQTGARDRAR
jgi:DnaJ like chaperone protein